MLRPSMYQELERLAVVDDVSVATEIRTCIQSVISDRKKELKAELRELQAGLKHIKVDLDDDNNLSVEVDHDNDNA